MPGRNVFGPRAARSITIAAAATTLPRRGALAALAAVALLAMPAAAAADTTPLQFGPADSYDTDNSPESVAIGDLNGDAKPDLATANQHGTSGGGNVSVLIANGDGSFAPQTTYAVRQPISVAIGDLNGDGKPDLATANEFSGSEDHVSVLLGNGDGTFAAETTYLPSASAFSVAIGDLNGDGKPDLAVAALAGVGLDYVSVLLGNGDGTFAAGTPYVVGDRPWSVAIGDLNGDAKPDLATANQYSDNVSVLLGNGDGTFAAQTTYAAGTEPISMAIGDLNGDAKPDLATANRLSDNVSVLLGNGDGTFAAQTTYAAGNSPRSVAIGDLNGDAKPDLATANQDSDNVSVLLGNGDGTFAAQTTYAAGATDTLPVSVAIGDLNGDAKPDLATANTGSDNVSVLLNGLPQTKITAGPYRTSDRTPTFKFKSSEPGSGFICRFDGHRKRRCASPTTSRRLAPGRHVFEVSAVNASGIGDPTPAVRRFKITK